MIERGTGPGRHPWFTKSNNISIAVLLKAHGTTIELHTQVSKNFGNLGGRLRCEFWCLKNGDPTGITRSSIEYQEAA